MPTPVDAGTDSKADVTPPPDAAETCGFAGPVPPMISATVSPNAMPSGLGGAITAGTYVLDAVTYYGAKTVVESWSASLVTTESAYKLMLTRNGTLTYQAGSISFQGSQFTISITCPSISTQTGTFSSTATAGEFTFYIPKDERALHFVKKI